MQDYKPNSNRFKEEERAAAVGNKKKVEKVISGTAKTKRKSQASKFADIFISEDAANVKSYIFMDVLVPAIKKAISDIVTDGIDMILYGGSRNKNKNSSPTNYVSYRSYSDRESRNDRFADSGRSRTVYGFDDIVLDTRGECERVLSTMGDLLDTYGMVTVADMYEMVGVTPRFTDYDHGWKFIGDARVEHTRDGYILVMPKVVPLK